jgi:hypothetical protein
MARPSRASQEKRNRERAKQEKQQEKRELRAQRKELRKTQGEDGVAYEGDPDLAGIVPGPQPPLDF